jgi:hypothetical protein
MLSVRDAQQRPPPVSGDPIGCPGRVTASGAISPGRTGEVMVALDGGVQAFMARDADDGTIEPYTEIVVVDRIGPRTVLVSRLYEREPAS